MVRRASKSTVFLGQLDHFYVSRTAEILRQHHPQLVIRETRDLFRPILTCGRVVVHLQWIDPALRQHSLLAAVKSATVLSLYVLILRIFGVRAVWTIHNPIGKNHDHPILDRALRTALAAICSQFVVLNASAANVTEKDLFPSVRRRFRRRVHTVPMPLMMRDHGKPMTIGEARARLGIATTKPVLVYLAGHNQPDRSADLRDPEGRYELISLNRNWAGASELSKVFGGWEFRGRPSDEEYGLLVCAGDALVMAGDNAFGSATLHTAVELRRPIISVACPATEELAALGGAVQIPGDLNPAAITSALAQVISFSREAFKDFEIRHSDLTVATALCAAYRAAGLNLPVAKDFAP